jgi:replicative DNA helicase
MADVSRRLISKIVQEGDFYPALNGGIRDHWFEEEEHRRVFQWMMEYYGRYNATPTARALKLEFPNYQLLKVDEPYEFYIDRFRDARTRTILVDTEIDLHEALEDGDLKLAKDRVYQGLNKVGAEVSSLSDLNVVMEWRSRFDEYEALRHRSDELTGICTGFDTYDHLTGGFHPEQFILFAGQAKAGKSWLMMKSAIAAQEQGKKVLFITFEMSLKEQLARYDGFTCQMDSNKLLRNTLSESDMRQLKDLMRDRRDMKEFIISADITATTTPSGLSGKIDEHRPDIVFVDGIYLMENEAGHQPGTAQAYTSLSRSMKRLAQRAKVPIVGTMQALSGKMDKTGRVTLHSLGWSSSWSQDADLVFGVERDPAVDLIKLRIVAGRNVSPKEVFIACDWKESRFEETECTESDEDD